MEANPSTVKLVGAKRKKDFIGKPIVDFIHPDSQKLAKSRIEKVLKTQKPVPVALEKFIRLDGEILYGEVVTLPVAYHGKPACMSIIRDITKRLETEEQLRESEKRYKKFFETAPYGIALHDGKMVISANRVAVRIVGGKSLKEMVGRPVMDFVHPSYRRGVASRLKKMVETGKSAPLFEEKFLRLDGTPIDVEVASSPVTYHGKPVFQVVFRDITAQKKAKQKVEQDKAQDEALLNSIGEGLVSIDLKGRIIFTNRAAYEMLGKPGRQLEGRDFSKVLTLVDEKGKKISKEKVPLQVVISTGKPLSVGALGTPYYYKSNGKVIPIAVTATPVVLGEKIIGAIVVFRDVSEEKQIDKAKTEFVSLASHQLLTPIASIKWYLEMVLAGDTGEIPEDVRKYLDTTYQAARRMGELVNALLNVSRIELGTFGIEPIQTDINELVRSVGKDLDALISYKNLKFSCYCKNRLFLNVDPNLMRIVVENLLSNAVKYTPEGGSVTVWMGRKNNHDFLLKVSDTGMGIPDEDKPRIFAKLFRGRNIHEVNPGGTGLGLYIVKSVVEKAGGKIWFESKEGKGTTFFVTIPIKGMPKGAGSKTLIRVSR